MTAQEMHYNFELMLNEQGMMDKSFTSYDVSMFLNRSQNDIVEGFYSSRINPESGYFELDERARAMLAFLIESTQILAAAFDNSSNKLHDNAVFADLPSNFLYALEEDCTVSYTDCNGSSGSRKARVLPIRHDEYSMNINNVYKKPWRDLVWRMDFSGSSGQKKHELIYGEGTSITVYRLRYLRKPVEIDINNGVDCELNPMLHEEVVDRAVAFALASKAMVKQNVEQITEK